MHLAPLIRDLALILAVAGLVSLIFRRIQQPVVLGYLVAGMIIGPYTPPFPLVTDIPNIKTLAELGVIFLMFSLGLEFSFRKLTRVGMSSGFTACYAVVIMSVLGYFTGRALGWSRMDSIFLGAMLSISSTTVILKSLDEFGLKSRRFAELIFGILIVEDLVAILLLVSLTMLSSAEGFSGIVLANSAAKLALVVGSWFLAGYFVIPRFVRYVGRFQSDEMLTVISVGLCLSLVAFAAYFEYSAALGAFIMGSILAESTESHRITEFVKPLRDVFAAIFFVSVGMLINPEAIWLHKEAIIIVTVVTIFGQVISTTLGSLIAGQSIKTSVLVGCSLGQIGEFSFIIAGLGLSLGSMSEFLYPVIVAVSLVTTFTSPYLIRSSQKFAGKIEDKLPFGMKEAFDRYVSWRQRRALLSVPDPKLNKLILRWVINAFLTTVIWVLTAEAGMQWMRTFISDSGLVISITWAAAILLSAPFIWAMLAIVLAGHRDSKSEAKRHPNAFILMQFTTLLWFALLSLSYFPVRYVGIITAVLGVALFTRLYRRLELSYRWFEEGFTEVFRGGGKRSRPENETFYQLAPWDEHLVRLRVHPDAPVVGETIKDAALRSKYKVNIVAIQRGSHAMVSPDPCERIYPKDELLLLGTDEQIEQVRPMLEASKASVSLEESIEGYDLRRITIGDHSALLGRSIRQSGIREKFGAMVVGIERRGRRIMNPESDMVIEIDDGLLVVGESDQLDQLIAKSGRIA